MSTTRVRADSPWYSDGRYWVSPFNYAPAVRAQLGFPTQMRIYDSTLRKILLSPTARITVTDALHVAELLREAGVRHMFLNVYWWGSKDSPEPLAYNIVKAVLERFDFEATVYLDDLWLPEWERRIDCILALGARTVSIHLPTADLQLRSPNAPSRDAVLERLSATVKYVRAAGARTTACIQDAARTDFEWLAGYLGHAVDLGVVRIDLCDSPSSLSPEGMKHFVLSVRERLQDRVPMTMHIHDDLGLADAGALAAATVGCWPDCAVNGVSYRAGFASLQNVVAALEILYGVDTGIDMTKFTALSKLVASLSYPIQPHRAITGDHAFVKEVPGSVAAALAAGERYFPPIDSVVSPEMFGAKTHVVWGRQTLAGAALQAKFQQLGLKATPGDVERVRRVLVQKLGAVRTHPYWLEDDEVSTVCREMLK